MLILHGTYHFARKKTAYRNDYCMACEEQRLAEQFQTFDAFHLFFIPLIPLGFRKRWHFAVCGRDPHERVKTSKNVKFVGLFCCLVFGIMPWLGQPTGEDISAAAIMSILSIAGFVYLIYSIRTESPAPTLENELKKVAALTGDHCPYCGGRLLPGIIKRCGSCDVQHLPLNQIDYMMK